MTQETIRTLRSRSTRMNLTVYFGHGFKSTAFTTDSAKTLDYYHTSYFYKYYTLYLTEQVMGDKRDRTQER